MKLSSDERQFGRIKDFVRDLFLIIRAFKIAVQLLYFIHIPNLYSINFSRQFFMEKQTKQLTSQTWKKVVLPDVNFLKEM